MLETYESVKCPSLLGLARTLISLLITCTCMTVLPLINVTHFFLSVHPSIHLSFVHASFWILPYARQDPRGRKREGGVRCGVAPQTGPHRGTHNTF